MTRKMLCQLIQKKSSKVCLPKLPGVSLFESRKKSKKRITICFSVGQIDRKNRKKKFIIILKWFADSLRKNPPICAGNVPKLPKLSLFEPREKSQKSMATSKVALQ